MNAIPPPDDLLAQLLILAARGPEILPALGLSPSAREFFETSWAQAQEALLSRTRRLRVWPSPPVAPRLFRFEVDCRYKRKLGGGPVEVAEGTLRGTIAYHPDPFAAPPQVPLVTVLLDPEQGFFHPNHSRRSGLLCLGVLPSGPPLLEPLLIHIYSILTYGNWRCSDPLDPEASLYFATHPRPLAGLEDPPPLF